MPSPISDTHLSYTSRHNPPPPCFFGPLITTMREAHSYGAHHAPPTWTCLMEAGFQRRQSGRSSVVCGARTLYRGDVHACPLGKAPPRGEAGRSTQGWWDTSATSFPVFAASIDVQPSVSSSLAFSGVLSRKPTFALSLLSLAACNHPKLFVGQPLDVAAQLLVADVGLAENDSHQLRPKRLGELVGSPPKIP